MGHLMKDSAETKDIKQKIWDDWYHAQTLSARFVNSQLEKTTHITMEQFYVLSMMDEMGKTANATEMAKKLAKNTNTLSTILDRMEINGLAKKTRDTQDRRIVYATMTDKGKKKLKAAKKTNQEVVEKLTSTFSQEELKMLDTLIEKFIKTIKKASN
jgi:MarR family transcriptional regulator, organic hydroperoxide resistance regulator